MEINGFLSPQAIDLEAAVLGAAILEKEAAMAVLSQISTDEIFYLEKHQVIFRAIRQLDQNREPVDLLTVIKELRKMDKIEEAGGPVFIVDLSTKINYSANLQTYIITIIEKWIRRKLIASMTELIRKSYEDAEEVLDILELAQVQIMSIQSRLSIKEGRTIGQIMPGVLKDIKEGRESKTGLLGIPSGITSLDKVLNGFRKSFLYIIGARPGMGKTAFIVEIMRSLLYRKIPVAIFSLEMSMNEIVVRMLLRDLDVTSEALTRRDGLDIEQIKDRTMNLNSDKVIIDDTASLPILQLRSKSVSLKAKYGIEAIFVDYLQLTRGYDKKTAFNRQQEIGQITRELKNIAKDLEMPVIALTQLSREVEKRADKRPQLSDLRESGDIEQDADVVMFLYRPEYYGREEEQGPDGQMYLTKNKCEVLIAKHRQGPTGDIILNCDVAKNKFWSENEIENYYGGGIKNLPIDFDPESGDVF